MIPAPPASSRSSISTFAVVAPYFPRRRRALDDAAGAPLALPSGRTSRLARPFPAMDLESREELLERLFDVGVASDDVTVADVTSRADPARFNAVASRLAADVAALAPAAGADDQRGVTAAAAAVYRAVAGAGANPAASSSRAEQALRRLAAAIDATAPSNRCGTPELLASLVTYAQAATMIARRAKATSETTAEPRAAIPAPDDDREGEGGPLGGPPGGAIPMDHSSAASPSSSTKMVKVKVPPPTHTQTQTRTRETRASAPARRRRARRRRPRRHRREDPRGRARLRPGGARRVRRRDSARDGGAPARPPRASLPPGAEAASRRTSARRSATSPPRWTRSTERERKPSPGARGSPRGPSRRAPGSRTSRTCARRSGGGGGEGRRRGRGDDSGSVRDSDSDLPYRVNVGLADVWDARVGDLARVDQRTNAEQARALEASAKRVRIGAVPDRGGRATRAATRNAKKSPCPPSRRERAPRERGTATRPAREKKRGEGRAARGGRGRGGGGGEGTTEAGRGRGNKW